MYTSLLSMLMGEFAIISRHGAAVKVGSVASIYNFLC